jgi:hypothetical protein
MGQLGRKPGQALYPPACESVLDENVLPRGIAELPQPLPEGVELWRGPGRAEEQEPNPGERPYLLRSGGERRRDEGGDGSKESPPVHHAIIRSTRSTSAGAIPRPRAQARHAAIAVC